MNWDQIKGQWRQVSGRMLSVWGTATDDDGKIVVGKGRVLMGKLQQGYGVFKDDAGKKVDRWTKGLAPAAEPAKSNGEETEKTPPQ